MSDLETFRIETRTWLEANCPAEMRTPVARDADICWGGRNCKFTGEAQKSWLDRMGAKGWTVPEWPAAYGGGGTFPTVTDANVVRRQLIQLP